MANKITIVPGRHRRGRRRHAFTLATYRLTEAFPKHEVFAHTSQLRRAAASVPSNFVEGFLEAHKTRQGPIPTISLRAPLMGASTNSSSPTDLRHADTTTLQADLEEVSLACPRLHQRNTGARRFLTTTTHYSRYSLLATHYPLLSVYTANEKLSSANITDIMQTAYIEYSMSVIISRALPDARDGLKPVQRRVLYAMLREGLVHNRPFDKCAGVVGEVLKNYHPHGDSSVYDTLVRLAQPWVMRYPLIDPQGNFGSVDGDPPAAYRYTEARLKDIAEDLLKDIEEDTVDFVPNYKESTTEPTVLAVRAAELC